MSKFTKNQKLAIELVDKNILINAGAGSGKTTVLTQRIIGKLKNKINIDELLVITFTRAAAQEMKERIEKSIENDNTIIDQLELLESADITTFDGFFNKIIKKFGYLENIGSIDIGEQIELDYLLKKAIDKVMDEKYKENNSDFIKLLDTYTIFSDEDLVSNLAELYKKYQNILKFEIKTTDELFVEYENIILSQLYKVLDKLKELKEKIIGTNFEKMMITYYDKFCELMDAKDYNSIVYFFENNKVPSVSSSKKEGIEEFKEIQKDIKTKIDNLRKKIILETKENIISIEKDKENYKNTLFEILNKIDEVYYNIKLKNKTMGFDDYTKLVLKLLKHDEVSNFYKFKYNEILIDEYQDTNDFQNKIINKIANNNLYLVGDVKQSIYKFRNTNPQNFLNLQNKFKKDENSDVINLLDNFRSREDVLESVNDFFNNLMTTKCGGVNYKDNHRLEYGNKSYDTKAKQNYFMEVYNYDEKKLGMMQDEIEIRIIAEDIVNKINSKFKILDENKLRECVFSDFVILTSTKSKYDMYLKIFEEYNIPIQAQMSEKINDKNNFELIFILNTLKLISNKYDKHALLSLLRSYVLNISDDLIHEYIVSDIECESITCVLNKIEDLRKYKYSSLEFLILEILDAFDILQKIHTINSFKFGYIKIEKYIKFAQNHDKKNKNLKEFIEFLEFSNAQKTKIELDFNFTTTNNVKLMTIHKSKGLEFNVVYIVELYKEISKTKQPRIDIDKKIGIILKNIDNYLVSDSFLNKIYESYEFDEDFSEKIRLIYVAMTRAKEKIIFVNNLKTSEKKINSILNKTINEKLILEIEEFNYTKYKNIFKDITYDNIKIDYKKIDLKFKRTNKIRASKTQSNILDKSEIININKGIKLHNELEHIELDKIHDDDYINEFEEIKIYLENLRKYDIFLNIVNYWTEYEFIGVYENKQINGIIDVIIEKENEVIILDYKLSNIDSKEYIRQLEIYKENLSIYFKKPIKCYLYSLNKNEMKRVI